MQKTAMLIGKMLIILISFSMFSNYASASNPSQAEDLIHKIEGVYKRSFQNGSVQGETYTSENILEIVPYEKDMIYFVIKSYFYNGHSCSVSGIAQYQDGKFIFSPSEPFEDQPCKLNISLKNGHIISIQDVNDVCRRYYCGVRGGLNDESFTLEKRRKIKYMERILNSRQYKEAISDFKKLKAKNTSSN